MFFYTYIQLLYQYYTEKVKVRRKWQNYSRKASTPDIHTLSVSSSLSLKMLSSVPLSLSNEIINSRSSSPYQSLCQNLSLRRSTWLHSIFQSSVIILCIASFVNLSMYFSNWSIFLSATLQLIKFQTYLIGLR